MTELAGGRDIVVGIDGSEASTAALRWAASQARALCAEVVAVHAWEPSANRIAPYAPLSALPTATEERDQAARLLASTVRAVFGPRIDGSVRAVLAEGPPARVLLEHARGALMLAVGRTAHGEYEGPWNGSVGRECLRHATIPVVAVPVADRPASPLRAVKASPLTRRERAVEVMS
ncbi:universal stress protein [Streptomyces sp. SYP-A7185]|uniref:universal stress protein n=1 Tax=Streptomyces sp. SYP-A7185 TaxID=3040076 RepID=UPI0038F65707